MKWKSVVIIALGLVLVAAVAMAILHLSSSDQSAPGTPVAGGSPTPVPPPTRSNVLGLFSDLREKINASGNSYGGAAVQVIQGDETAMVYIYKPVGKGDVSSLLAAGFSTLYSVFDTKDPLLVGLVDTTQKINPQQFKVDIYSLERPAVQQYVAGNLTGEELMKKALYVTSDTASLRPNNTTGAKKSLDLGYNRSGNYTPPSNRTMVLDDYLTENGYSSPLSLQSGPLSDGTKGVSVVLSLKANATDADKYDEIEAALKACAQSYGDFDRYMISLMPSQEGVYDYYTVDAPAPVALAFADGDISQYQLYNDLNLVYYTK